MKFFKCQEEYVQKRVTELGNMTLTKSSHLFGDYGNVPIKQATFQCLENEKKSEKKPAIIFLRVVLAANRDYNKVY